MSETEDSTLSGLGRRMKAVESDVETLETKLDKIVLTFQRVQWTFTGLVFYYIIDHAGLGGLLKIIAKGLV